MRHLPALAALLLPLAACVTHADAGPADSALSASQAHGLAFAQERCSGCHAVAALKVSPNPEAPTFEEIVARPGLTSQTLSAFLRDSHSYPDRMNFTIAPDEIEDLTAYMLTLRKAD